MRLSRPAWSIKPGPHALRTPCLRIAVHECAPHSLPQPEWRTSALACIPILSRGSSRPRPRVSDGPGPDRTRNALATPAPEQARRTRRRARAARKGPTRSAAARRTLSAAARAAARSRPSSQASAASSSCARPLSRAPGRRERPSEQPMRRLATYAWGG